MRNWEIAKLSENLNSEILNNSQTLFSTNVLYAIMKNKRCLTPYYQDYIRLRDELVIKFGDKDEDTGKYTVCNTNTEFISEFEKLNNIDNPELDTLILKISRSDLPETMTIKEFELLDEMLL